MVKPFLEDLTLEEAIEKKRVFIIDLAILEGISTRDNLQVSSIMSFMPETFPALLSKQKIIKIL